MGSEKTLLDRLRELNDSQAYPYHMPGHKRNPAITDMGEFYGIDITEIEGFDNLHRAEGILRSIEELARDLYGCEDALMSVNGSTAGVLAALMSQTKQGEKVLMARGCHKSVYHALFLNRLVPHYLISEEELPYGVPGEITASQVEAAMKESPDCKVVVITSPTYEGLVFDVQAIAEVVHDRGGILIVDAAHGAHFGISDNSIPNPVALGADLVIVSLHKTLPAMTQTALVLVGSNRINRKALKQYMAMIQTSSPSYVLMASIEQSLLYAKKHGAEACAELENSISCLKEAIKDCRHVGIYDGALADGSQKKWDAGKVVIAAKNGEMSGPQLMRYLREEQGAILEMDTAGYVLAMFTVADTKEAYLRMEKALLELDRVLECSASGLANPGKMADTVNVMMKIPEAAKPIWEAVEAEAESIDVEKSLGRVAAEFVGVYPPGIPILTPGERIDETQIYLLKELMRREMSIQGIDACKIMVCK